VRLDQRITISEKRQTRTADGTLAVQFVPRFTVWAHLRPKSGTQRNHAQQTENPANYEFAIRNSGQAQSTLPADVLTWRGRTMEITWVGYREPQRHYLHIDARDGVAV
jgi:SPP1 family predicted phage head-tail adaptor